MIIMWSNLVAGGADGAGCEEALHSCHAVVGDADAAHEAQLN